MVDSSHLQEKEVEAEGAQPVANLSPMALIPIRQGRREIEGHREQEDIVA